MPMRPMIDELIEAGWDVLNSDFDRHTFLLWREKVSECVSQLLGPEHAYAQFLAEHADGAEERSVLAAAGLLIAVREKIRNLV
ncbi:MAG: hypothetical protein FJ118_13515 [Deltaproteobacteria bacterium]|nr:hypothetical protein [Deltaproteobacteria bacterium]